MNTPTYTKAGTKATTAVKLPKEIFGIEKINHVLLHQAYRAYLANGRTNNARTKTRGEVSGGGKKPWKQKGTGRARFGSIRVPIWRGGGITFGPTGNENYSETMPVVMKRTAVKHALSSAAAANKLIAIESFAVKDNKTANAAALLKKVSATRKVLVVTTGDTADTAQATRNLSNTQVLQARSLTVYHIMNADSIIMTNDAIEAITTWLSGKEKVSK